MMPSILLNLSAVFDTRNHVILLKLLKNSIVLSRMALSWISSYLSDRMEYVALGESHLQPVTRGSVLGPIWFILDMLPLSQVISWYEISFHCYADDTRLYLRTAPSPSAACSCLNICLEVWMQHNFLQRYSSKTEAIHIASPITQPHHCRPNHSDIHLRPQSQNLGVKFDSCLSFESHINRIYKTSP